MSEWKPEMAPQAMVMKQKGNTLPAKIGPVPSTKRVTAGRGVLRRNAPMPGAHRERPPRALAERVHHDEREHGDQDHHDEEDPEERRKAAERADLVLGHLPE